MVEKREGGPSTGGDEGEEWGVRISYPIAHQSPGTYRQSQAIQALLATFFFSVEKRACVSAPARLYFYC